MTYQDFLTQNVTKIVTKRVKITERQADKLAEIDEELGIPPSAIIRLALNCFLPKLRDEQYRYGGIKELWDKNKF